MLTRRLEYWVLYSGENTVFADFWKKCEIFVLENFTIFNIFFKRRFFIIRRSSKYSKKIFWAVFEKFKKTSIFGLFIILFLFFSKFFVKCSFVFSSFFWKDGFYSFLRGKEKIRKIMEKISIFLQKTPIFVFQKKCSKFFEWKIFRFDYVILIFSKDVLKTLLRGTNVSEKNIEEFSRKLQKTSIL